MSRGGARPGAGRKKVTLRQLIESGEWNWRNPTHRRCLEQENVEGDSELEELQWFYRDRIHGGRQETSFWARRFQDRIRELHRGAPRERYLGSQKSYPSLQRFFPRERKP